MRNMTGVYKLRHWILRVLHFILFLACLVFVSHRGYKCVEKYLQFDTTTEMSYQFQGKLPFPTITFCLIGAKGSYLGYLKTKKDRFDACQLQISDYIRRGKFYGQGNESCTDPKKFQLWISSDLSETRIDDSIKIEFFDGTITFLKVNQSYPYWSIIPRSMKDRCHSLDIPEEFTKRGIQVIDFNSDVDMTMTFHQYGLFGTDEISSTTKVYHDHGIEMPVEHDVSNFLDYDGQECNKDPAYNKFECIQKEFHKVVYLLLKGTMELNQR